MTKLRKPYTQKVIQKANTKEMLFQNKTNVKHLLTFAFLNLHRRSREIEVIYNTPTEIANTKTWKTLLQRIDVSVSF